MRQQVDSSTAKRTEDKCDHIKRAPYSCLWVPSNYCRSFTGWESTMNENESADERAAREKFEAWLREMKAAAAEIVEVGGC